MNSILKLAVCSLLVSTSVFADVFIDQFGGLRGQGVKITFTGNSIQEYEMIRDGFRSAGIDSRHVELSCSGSSCVIKLDERSKLLASLSGGTLSNGTSVGNQFAIYLSGRSRGRGNFSAIEAVRKNILDSRAINFVEAQLLLRVRPSGCSTGPTNNTGGGSGCIRRSNLVKVGFPLSLAAQTMQGHLMCSVKGTDFAGCIIASTEMVEALESGDVLSPPVGSVILSTKRIKRECKLEKPGRFNNSIVINNILPGESKSESVSFKKFPYRRHQIELQKLVSAINFHNGNSEQLSAGEITCTSKEDTRFSSSTFIVCKNNTNRTLSVELDTLFKTCNTPK